MVLRVQHHRRSALLEIAIFSTDRSEEKLGGS